MNACRVVYVGWSSIRAAVLLTALGARSLAAQRGASTIPVQAAVDVAPDTVRVGDPFVVRVGIRTPRAATIVFPPGPDSTAAVQALDPTRVETRDDTAALVEWAYYRVAAWATGDLPIVLGNVTVRLGNDVRQVPLAGSHVFVASVLPADTTQRVPKPPRPLYDFGAPLWWLWALAAAVLLFVLLLWWWWRRRRRGAPAVAVDPFVHAEREFVRIEALRLIDAGERGRHVALMVDVLREYLARRYDVAPLSLTSSELLATLRGQRAVPHDKLARLLGETDLIKFARRPVTAERARELGREARAIVAQEHTASTPATPAQKAA
jgi:hypothetical protein